MNLSKKIISSMLVLCLFPAFSTTPEELSYTNINIGYLSGETDDVNIDGYVVRGNWSLNKHFYLIGQYNAIDYKNYPADFNRKVFGLGAHRPVSDSFDWVSGLTYINVNSENNNYDGYEVLTGLRGYLTDKLEIDLQAFYNDFVEDSGELGYYAEVRWLFSENLSLGLKYRSVDEVSTAALDLGFGF